MLQNDDDYKNVKRGRRKKLSIFIQQSTKLFGLDMIVILLFSQIVCAICADNNTAWSSKWFPRKPDKSEIDAWNKTQRIKADVEVPATHNIPMGISKKDCDNAQDNLERDFDPDDVGDSLRYICLGNRTLYKPKYSVEPILRENIVPAYYVPLHKCMNESIEYEDLIPTFGTHRPLWAKYGEYKYLPVQRWLHNIEHGGLIMLYHPCAYYDQVEKLKLLVVNCLYRHVITSSKRVSPERPLALVAWGRSLEMSVVDTSIVINFIKKFALKGPEKTYRNGQYDKLLIKKAEIVSTEDDSVLCPNYS